MTTQSSWSTVMRRRCAGSREGSMRYESNAMLLILQNHPVEMGRNDDAILGISTRRTIGAITQFNTVARLFGIY